MSMSPDDYALFDTVAAMSAREHRLTLTAMIKIKGVARFFDLVDRVVDELAMSDFFDNCTDAAMKKLDTCLARTCNAAEACERVK